MRKLRSRLQGSEIPTSSMADIAFLLIIFFMVTAVFSATKGLQLGLSEEDDNTAPVAPDGILILAGPSIEPGVRLHRPHVMDLAPMILYLQGLPLAADMAGGVFRDALRDAFAERVPPRQIATYEVGPRARPEGAPLADPELDADARRRLCALGYIECD